MRARLLVVAVALAMTRGAHISTIHRLRGGAADTGGTATAGRASAAALAAAPPAPPAPPAETPEWAEGKLAQKETFSFVEALPWLEHVRTHGVKQ